MRGVACGETPRRLLDHGALFAGICHRPQGARDCLVCHRDDRLRGDPRSGGGVDAIVAQGIEAGGHRGAFDQAAAERQGVGLFALPIDDMR
jgi:hypothetical protein